jgi:hypothetical protein
MVPMKSANPLQKAMGISRQNAPRLICDGRVLTNSRTVSQFGLIGHALERQHRLEHGLKPEVPPEGASIHIK